MNPEVLEFLLEGDVSIQYQVVRDLLDGRVPPDLGSSKGGMAGLRDRISTEGWGARLLAERKANGHWGLAFYQPKWTSSNYTLMDLCALGMRPDHPAVRETVHLIATTEKGSDGGINPSGTVKQSDVCINGMFLNYGCYFGEPEPSLVSVVDFILEQHMDDGGFNCRRNRSGASHSSMHSTIQVLEGLLSYERAGYNYREDELRAAANAAREFLLRHRLYKSDRTGEIIHKDFLRLSYPPRWKYNVLRALDHFRAAGVPWDDRMSDGIDFILRKRRKDGKWPLHAAWPGQVHFRMEDPGGPSRWNTLIALRVLRAFGSHSGLSA